jgi:hypothetical protein
MAFPVGWPPRPSSGVRSIRFYVTGTTTANWSDNAFLFVDDVGANTYLPTPVIAPGSSTVVAIGDRSLSGSPMGAGLSASDVLPGDTVGQTKNLIWSNSIRIANRGSNTLEFTFGALTDGSSLVQGSLIANESVIYRQRYEAGIALRFPAAGAGSAFIVECW